MSFFGDDDGGSFFKPVDFKEKDREQNKSFYDPAGPGSSGGGSWGWSAQDNSSQSSWGFSSGSGGSGGSSGWGWESQNKGSSFYASSGVTGDSSSSSGSGNSLNSSSWGWSAAGDKGQGSSWTWNSSESKTASADNFQGDTFKQHVENKLDAFKSSQDSWSEADQMWSFAPVDRLNELRALLDRHDQNSKSSSSSWAHSVAGHSSSWAFESSGSSSWGWSPSAPAHKAESDLFSGWSNSSSPSSSSTVHNESSDSNWAFDTGSGTDKLKRWG